MNKRGDWEVPVLFFFLLLYGLQAADPSSMVGGAILLVIVGLAASWIPARRAAGVQPMEALRHE